MAKNSILFLCLIATAFGSLCAAYDPQPFQDFCVADASNIVRVNRLVCKDPDTITADDFFFSGLQKAGNTTNTLGSAVMPVFAAQFPGLNTLGISLARINFTPWGLNPPHIHPKASEVLTVIEGTLQVGFVSSAPNNKLFTKVLNKGDIFAFPMGLIHFQRNVG